MIKSKRPVRPSEASFLSGILVSIGFLMMAQDWLGLEGWKDLLTNHWIDLHWLVGAVVSFIGMVAYILASKLEEKRQNDKPKEGPDCG